MRFEVYTFQMFFFPKSVFLNFYIFIHIKRPTGTCCFTFPRHGIISVKTEIKRRLCKIKKRFSLVCKYLRTKVNIVVPSTSFSGCAHRGVRKTNSQRYFTDAVCLSVNSRPPAYDRKRYLDGNPAERRSRFRNLRLTHALT